ncbi:MAG TPA: CotH kinase family protein, partial [Gemmataceae bacterium]|nr:CotH kinase family protein [Gemmataceae bacterium]
MRITLAVLLLTFAAAAPAPAAVVVNEIMYHPPDDRDDLQFVELHNTGDAPVDLAGWRLKGARYQFPAGSSIAANGYLVVCKDAKAFKPHYGFDAIGEFEGTLGHSAGAVELIDAAGKTVDVVKYRTRAPWPVAADGSGSSLERICPTAPASVENWAPSPLPEGTPRAAGTPGKKNSVYVSRLPPVVSNVTFAPSHAAPDEEIKVEAAVRSGEELSAVELRYRVAGPGTESAETTVGMTKGSAGKYAATIPGQKAGRIIRFRVRAADAKGTERFFPSPNELRPALSVYVHDQFPTAKVPLGFLIDVGTAEFRAAQRGGGFRFGGGQIMPNPPARGRSAFVYVDPKSGKPDLSDFISAPLRTSGWKVRFHKDHPLGDMTTINLIYEPIDRMVLAEPLSYEVYRKAGNVAPRTDFVRTWIDGRPIGFQLLIEQPNKAFLRHAGLKADGNMYKANWMGRSVVERHEKKTNTNTGHDDVVQVIDRLNKSRGDEQWAVIKKEFDVEQMINFYAVHVLVSDWDGFFNNYFVYHDVGGTGKWTMYAWDQDKTWGLHDGVGGYDVFTDMPLRFGMAGD